MATDVILNNSRGYFSFEWTEKGDISTAQTLDTFIFICIFEEQRALASEIANPRQRRGWRGNETTPDFEIGSKAWLFYQARATGSTLADLGPVLRNSLQPLIDEGIAVSVEVETPFLKNGFVCVFISIKKDRSPVERKFFELWENTPNRN